MGAQSDLETRLTDLLNSLRSAPNGLAITQAEAQLRGLALLRRRLDRSDPAGLVAMRAEITASVAATQVFVQQTLSSSAIKAQVLSMEDYRRGTEEIDRRVARSYVAENRHLADARDIARHYGIDISGYEQERTALEQKRDEAQRKGDKVAERQADALIAQNTYNTMAGETDRITDPQERARHLTAMQDQAMIVAQRRRALEEQIGLEAQREAADQHLSPADANAFVARSEKEQMTQFDARAATLKTSENSDAARTELKTLLIAGMPAAPASPAQESGKQPQTVPALRTSYGPLSGSIDDFDMANPQTVPITLATETDAHTKVEVPKAVGQLQPGTGTHIRH